MKIIMKKFFSHIQAEDSIIMRLDKYLKQSRLIKRRVVAKEAAENSFVYVNDKIVKPSYKLSIGDIIKINFKKINYCESYFYITV